MKRVWVKSDSLRWPDRCACCLEQTKETLELGSTKVLLLGVATVGKSLALEVPYCQTCQAHAAWHKDLGMFGKVLKTVFVSAAGAGLWAAMVWASARELYWGEEVPGYVSSFLIPFGVLGAIVLGGLYLRYQWRRRPPSLGPEHCCRSYAIKVRQFYRENIELGIRNDEFARLVEGVNREPPPA
jgi:hypothetical protein